MKSLFRILPLLAAIVLFSCTKEEVSPSTPGGASTVQVEYRVSAVSSDMTVYVMLPAAGQTVLTEEKVDVNRSTYTHSFTVTSGTEVSVRATNRNPGPEEVIAEIYVNGTLAVSASANAPGQYANASVIAK